MTWDDPDDPTDRRPRSDYELCNCERGRYNPDRYTSCYECYQERAEGMASCIFCGRWHSLEYSTCYRCRPQRDEAGQALRAYIEWRDEYRCRNCGQVGVINIDHIQPCRHGGGVALWNLQVLCAGCNRVKGSAWLPGGGWSQIRRGLYAYYATAGRRWLDEDQHGYAHNDHDAKDPVSRLEVWDGWLAHDAALVLSELPVETPTPTQFRCPECEQPIKALYGPTGEAVCLDCWTTNEQMAVEAS